MSVKYLVHVGYDVTPLQIGEYDDIIAKMSENRERKSNYDAEIEFRDHMFVCQTKSEAMALAMKLLVLHETMPSLELSVYKKYRQ